MAGPDDPVTLALVPTLPPMINFGTGETDAEGVVDSHIQVFWPDVELAIYPLIDDSVQRLLAFRFNLVANVSIVPQATGSLQIMVDTLELADVYESYNEIGTDFDPFGGRRLNWCIFADAARGFRCAGGGSGPGKPGRAHRAEGAKAYG